MPADAATVPPRVLLVEDDASIRRFVRIALEEMPLELVDAQTLAAARAALAAAPVRLVICDLMLPDGSGAELLQELATARGGATTPRLVAFSAGLSAERRERLAAIGVDELLDKPVALSDLEACVRRGLGDGPPASAPAAPAVPEPAAPVADVVARYFGGDAALFSAFRASCLPLFARDRETGDAALGAGDLAALRRVAHSLKSVLLTLGHEAASECARGIEAAAAGGDADAAATGWNTLRGTLQALADGR